MTGARDDAGLSRFWWHPDVSAVVSVLGERLDAVVGAPSRRELVRIAPAAVGTGTDGNEELREFLALDWLLRRWLPAWLDIDDPDHAATGALRATPRLDGPGKTEQVLPVARSVLEHQNLDERRRSVAEFVSTPVFETPEEQRWARAAQESVGDALRFLFPERIIAVYALPGERPVRRPRSDHVWVTAEDAVWTVAPGGARNEVPWSEIQETVRQKARRSMLRRATYAARCADQAWEKAWASGGRGDDARDRAREAALEAVGPPVRSTAWSASPAPPPAPPRGLRRWRQEARRRRIPTAQRADAVSDAVLGALQAHLEPTVTDLQQSAVALVGDMIDTSGAGGSPSVPMRRG